MSNTIYIADAFKAPETIAQRIIREGKEKVYSFSFVVGECHTHRVSHHVDQQKLLDTYTFEDGSKISLGLELVTP